MGITTYYAASAANKTLSNLTAPTEVSAALIPDTHNTYDLGADAARWVNGYFGGVLTCYDLVVESGSSIHLAGATFENRGHYTSVDTNFGIKHDDSSTAFFAIYAENTSNFTHANILLDAQGSALEIIKNAPSNQYSPGMAGVVNEGGNLGLFVDHDSEISFSHYTDLTKDEYGNITYMSGHQTLARLTDEHLYLESIDLEIHDPEHDVKVLLSKDTDSYIDTGYGLCIGGTDPGYEVMLKVIGASEFDEIGAKTVSISQRQNGLTIHTSVDNDVDLIQFDTLSGGGYFKWDDSAGAYQLDHPLKLTQDHDDYGGVLWLEESANAPTVAETGSGHQLWAGSDHQLYWMDQTGNSVTLGAWTVPGTEGITYDPGSDASVNIFTVNVSGGPVEPLWQYDWANDTWTTTRPIAMSGWAQGDPFRWLYASDGTGKTELWTSNTTPEGAIDTAKGALAVDYTEGDLYIKTTANGTSGWEKFGLDLWSRNGTTLSPTTAEDDVNFTGNILIAAGSGMDYGIRIGSGDSLYIGNNDSLVYDRAGVRWIAAEGEFWVGYWGVGGDLHINAEDGGTAGAKCRIYVGGDYNDDIDYYIFKTVEDDLYIGPDTDSDALKFTASGAAVAAAFNVDLTVNGTISGNDADNWNTAYGWGDHAGLYDAAGTANAAIAAHESTYNHASYDTAYGWGDHSAEGYWVGTGALSELNGATDGAVAVGNSTGGLSTYSDFVWDNSTGRLGIGTPSPARSLHIQDSGGVIRVDRDANSPAIIIARFPSGNFTTPHKTFVLGVKGEGADDGSFFITDAHQSVSSGDSRFTIENDGTVDIPNDLKLTDADSKLGIGTAPTYDFHIEKSSAGTVTSMLYNSSATDAIADHFVCANGAGDIHLISNNGPGWFYGVAAGGTGISVPNGNTLTIAVGDSGSASEMLGFDAGAGTVKVTGNLGVGVAPSHKLDVSGTINTDTRVQTPEVYNSAGDLKLQPDVGGNVALFGDTDVSNGEDGNALYVHRRAAEGNEYMRFYITASQKGMIHTSADLTMQGQTNFVINSVTKDITLKVGDSVGAKKVYVKDSNGTDVAYIDSNGDAYFDGDVGANGDLNVGGVSTLPAVETDAVLFPGGSTIGQSQLSPFEWRIGNAVYEGTKDLSPETDGPMDVCFKPDGSKFYVVDNQLKKVFEYEMTTPWDVSTASYNSADFATTNSTGPASLFFRPDGKSMFIGCTGTDAIHEYSLLTAWDITSASWTQEFDCSTWDGIPVGLHFRPDGRRMYILGGTGDDVTEFVLPTAWDISAANYTQEFGTNIDNPEGLSFNPDGSKMYVTDGSAEDDIHEFELTYPWDVSTAVLSKLFHVNEDSVPTGITFRPDGTRMYVLGNNTDSIYEYHLGIVCHGHVAIGHDGDWGSLPLDVRSADDNQIFIHDTRNQAEGYGAGIMFGGTYTDAGDMAVGARIGTAKSNGTSNNFDFDLVFETQNTDDSSILEKMRITSEGYVGINCNPEYLLDVDGDGVIARFCRGTQNKLHFYGDSTSTDIRFAGTKDVNRIGTWIDKSFSIVANSTEMATFDPTQNAAIFSSQLRVSRPSPKFHIEETDADTNEKVWEWKAANGVLSLVTRTDAYAAGYSVFKVDRSGTTPGVVSFPSDARVSIGTNTPETSAALEIKSTNGALLLPRMTSTQRNAMTAVNGMIIYDTTQNAFRAYENGAWRSM